VFARKPAPVQASWIGYFNTTGLDAIDYVLTDAASVPPGSERWFTEQVVRLPVGRFCYTPPDLAPDVAPPPMLARGRVTFGSFNNLSKVTPPVIELWARVVNAVPDARLVLKWRSLADPRECQRLLAAFEAAGLAPGRVELRPHGPHAAMLAEYGDLDVALDPFPFTGGLTSCEALWMGVPVVTLPGTRPVSRQTAGLLAQLGLEALAARDSASYVAIAAGLARDPVRLASLRATLRSRMAASSLCDAARFARGLEAAYRELWRRWCMT
jgi:predicted O-linked N-acetylglucosamine transferase (SPINDLY family)